ncbi:RIP metalloprotease, partial [Lactobacillus sp. XV13L]|nr:RIP metalloprotease [Lactobacillus sp. XV13L]
DATIIDESGSEMQIAPLDDQFNSASLLNRFLTNLAGPFNNLVFGIIVYIISAFLIGGPLSSGNKLGEIQAHSPAANAQLQPGDQILQVETKKVTNWDQLAQAIAQRAGKATTLTIRKADNKVQKITVKPKTVKNGKDTIGQIGIMPQRNHQFGPTLKYGFTSAFNSMGIIVNALKRMVSGGFNINQLGGPVAIYSQTSQVAAMGYKQVIIFIAWLSINLGIM